MRTCVSDSLAGNAKIRLIATLSPSALNAAESINTLKVRTHGCRDEPCDYCFTTYSSACSQLTFFDVTWLANVLCRCGRGLSMLLLECAVWLRSWLVNAVVSAYVCVVRLQFADSAKRVMTRARMNTSLVPDRILVKRLQAEVERLKRLIMAQGDRDGGSGTTGSNGGSMAAHVRASQSVAIPLSRPILRQPGSSRQWLL